MVGLLVLVNKILKKLKLRAKLVLALWTSKSRVLRTLFLNRNLGYRYCPWIICGTFFSFTVGAFYALFFLHGSLEKD